MKRFKYLVGHPTISPCQLPKDRNYQLESWLDDKGEHGWELVSTDGGRYIFKREE